MAGVEDSSIAGVDAETTESSGDPAVGTATAGAAFGVSLPAGGGALPAAVTMLSKSSVALERDLEWKPLLLAVRIAWRSRRGLCQHGQAATAQRPVGLLDFLAVEESHTRMHAKTPPPQHSQPANQPASQLASHANAMTC